MKILFFFIFCRALQPFLETRELIIRIYEANPRQFFKTIAKKAKVHQKTVSCVIKNYKTNLNIQRKIGSGRKKGFASPVPANKIIASLERDPGTSNRKLALKVGCSEGTVRNVKKNRGYKSYKVQSVPDRNATKNMEAQRRARKLKANFFNKKKCCIMDYETYVLCDFSQLPGQEFYTARSRGGVEKKFRTR